MATQDITPTKDKILEVMKRKGPSLPIHIANEIKLSTLFASAFLADLLSNKEIKMSYMKVGNTPVYLLPGQESQLENYSQHLKSREKDAYLLLKENKFLEDEKQEPAIRVALRAIKDFAIPFKNQEKIIWRYFTALESEYNPLPSQIEEKEKLDSKNIEEKNSIEEPQNIQKENSEEKIIEEIKKEPKEENISTEIKEKSLEIFDNDESFIEKSLKHLRNNNKIKIIEETELKKKDFLGIGRIESDIGEIEILLMAKDKKKISEKDLEKIKEKVQESNKMAVLFSNGEIDKKAIEKYRQLKGLILIKNL